MSFHHYTAKKRPACNNVDENRPKNILLPILFLVVNNIVQPEQYWQQHIV
jgi:hypothetical protein